MTSRDLMIASLSLSQIGAALVNSGGTTFVQIGALSVCVALAIMFISGFMYVRTVLSYKLVETVRINVVGTGAFKGEKYQERASFYENGLGWRKVNLSHKQLRTLLGAVERFEGGCTHEQLQESLKNYDKNV